ncbi:TolB family protein [Gracilimonas sp.]|uniref:TolB family protein n=1 Tax=Gracilimonas sp. TaxID=1974203 RepID=UPI0028714AF7|nr:hypothetical protein [Gracilimonas sp.]
MKTIKVFKRISFVTLMIVFGACTLLGENDSEETPLEDPPPVGGKLVFSMEDSATEQRQIFTMNIDGSELIRLTDNRRASGYPAWSPDGNRIAYSTDLIECSGDPCVYLMNEEGSGKGPMGMSSPYPDDEITGAHSSWGPDGNMIAFNRCLGFPGCGFVSVYDLESDSLKYISGGWYPSWSPDGAYLVYSSGRAYQDEEEDHWREDLYLANASGKGESFRLTTLGEDYEWFEWIRENEVLFLRHNHQTDLKDVILINIDTGKRETIARDIKVGYLKEVLWYPEGESLFIVSYDLETGELVFDLYNLNWRHIQNFRLTELDATVDDIDWHYEVEANS